MAENNNQGSRFSLRIYQIPVILSSCLLLLLAPFIPVIALSNGHDETHLTAERATAQALAATTNTTSTTTHGRIA